MQSDSRLPPKSSCVFFFGHCESFPFIVVSFRLKKKKSKVISLRAAALGPLKPKGLVCHFYKRTECPHPSSGSSKAWARVVFRGSVQETWCVPERARVPTETAPQC